MKPLTGTRLNPRRRTGSRRARAVRAKLAGMAGELRERGVLGLSLFGSVARGEATAQSDIDVVIDTREGFDLFDLASLTCFLEERTGTRVDVINRNSLESRRCAGRALREDMRSSILRDLTPVIGLAPRFGGERARSLPIGCGIARMRLQG